MTRIYLVRHCEARGNADRVFQGSTDADISERGVRQLEKLSERFRSVKLDAIYSSPLRRALCTADAINRYHGLSITIEPEIREINGGHWEGRKWSDFPILFPDEARDWNLAPYRFAPEGGEPMTSVYDRMKKAVCEIARREKNRRIAVVSHGCAIRNFLCFAHGYPIERLNDIDWSDNTGVSVIEFDENLHPKVILENDVSHFTQGLSTFADQDWWKKENRDNLKFD